MSNTQLRRTEVDEDIGSRTSTTSHLDESKERPAHGSKRNMHSNIYHLKLLMLIFIRALKLKVEFQLECEIKEAEKFDDIILKYKKENDREWTQRFFQAKHKLDDRVEITENDLCKVTEKKLCLQKYFISYCNIMNNPKFDGKKENFVICTNIDFEKEFKDNFDPVEGKDDILDIRERNECARFKLGIKEEHTFLSDKLLPLLKKTSDLENLAKTVANNIYINNKLSLNNPLFKKYHVALANEIINTKDKKVKAIFVEGSTAFSKEVMIFRKHFFKNYNQIIEKNFKTELQNKKFNIPKSIGKLLTLKEYTTAYAARTFSTLIFNKRNVTRIILTQKTFNRCYRICEEFINGGPELSEEVKVFRKIVFNSYNQMIKNNFRAELETFGTKFVKKEERDIEITVQFILPLILEQNTDQKWHGVLENVINKRTNKFFSVFRKGSAKLSTDAKEFREIIFDCYKGKRNSFTTELRNKIFIIPDGLKTLIELKECDTSAAAKMFAELIFNKENGSKGIELQQIFAKCHRVLAEVIKAKSSKIDKKFIDDGPKLSKDVKEFRNFVFDKYVKEDLKSKVVTTVKIFGKSKENTTSAEITKLLPNDEVNDVEINEFLDKLVFAINQPNEQELGEIIKEELGAYIHLDDADFIISNFQRFMLDWMISKESTCLTNEDGEIFFKKIRQKMSVLEVNNFSKDQSKKTKNYNITFASEFLTFLNLSSKTIFNLCSSHGTMLGTIKVCQILEERLDNAKEGTFICLPLSTILRNQDAVIKVLRTEAACDLLVIECDTEYGITDTLHELLKSIQMNGRKKIILITQGDDTLADQLKNSSYALFGKNAYEEKKDEGNSFRYFDSDTQKRLLKRHITFQRKKISLGKLMEIEDVNKLSKKESDYLDAIIDPDTLVQLMGDGESIEVGIKQPHLSDLESNYYVASATIDDEQLLSAVRNYPSDLFVIAGMTKDEVSDMLTPEERDAVRVLEEDDARMRDKFVILNKENEEKYVEHFKEICKVYSKVKGDTFISAHLIEKKNDHLVWKRSYDASFYIRRKLCHAVINTNSLRKQIRKKADRENMKDIFGISNITAAQLKNNYALYSSTDISTNIDSEKKNHIVIIQDENEEECFSSLCSSELLEYYNIHWLQHKGNRLVWKRSKGEMKNIREMQDTTSMCPVDEGELDNIIDTERVVVIAADAGAGKSTTLTRLFKESEQREWIIKLKLIDLQAQLKELAAVDDLDGFIEKFFSKIAIGVKEKFAKVLLKYRMKEKDKITLLFDGFDEVSHDNQKLVINMIRYLKNYTKVKTQITTRLHVKDKLESELSVLSYTFRPFSDADQQEFLKKFWEASLKFTSGNEVVIDGFYNVDKNKSSDYLSNPLLIRMFAEYCQETVQVSCCPGRPVESRLVEEVKGFSIWDLHKEFLSRKYKIYFTEKTNIEAECDSLNNVFRIHSNKYHQRLAFRKLFPDNEHTEIIADERKLLPQHDENNLKAVGIIQSVNSDGNNYFIHRTFAEYFAADLLVDMLGRREDCPKYKSARQFLITQIFRDCNKVIRVFCENRIIKECDDNLSSKWKVIYECDLLGDIAKERLLNFYSDEDSNMRTESQHNGSERSLTELKQVVELQMIWQEDNYHRGGYFYNGDGELFNRLFQQFLKETDIRKLQDTLEFLITANGTEYIGCTNEVFSRNANNYEITKHYLTQAEQQHDVEYKSVLEMFSAVPDFNTFKNNIKGLTDRFANENQKKKYTEKLLHFLMQQEPQTAQLLYFVMKYLYPGIKQYFIQSIEKLHYKLKIQIPDNFRFKTAANFKILTPKMSVVFNSILYDGIPYYDYYNEFYVSCIFEDLIIPVIDMMMKKEQLHDVDRLSFLKMLSRFTQFSMKQKMKDCRFTTDQLKTTFELIETLLKDQILVDEVLWESTTYLFALAKAGLKLINADHMILVLDPASEFQYELKFDGAKERKEQIVELIRWKLKNPNHMKEEFIEKCHEVVSKQVSLKRRRSESDIEELIKRRRMQDILH